jgi:uncharacterized membrane protein YccC
MPIVYFSLFSTSMVLVFDSTILGLILAAVIVLWLVRLWWPHRNDFPNADDVW